MKTIRISELVELLYSLLITKSGKPCLNESMSNPGPYLYNEALTFYYLIGCFRESINKMYYCTFS